MVRIHVTELMGRYADEEADVLLDELLVKGSEYTDTVRDIENQIVVKLRPLICRVVRLHSNRSGTNYEDCLSEAMFVCFTGLERIRRGEAERPRILRNYLLSRIRFKLMNLSRLAGRHYFPRTWSADIRKHDPNDLLNPDALDPLTFREQLTSVVKTPRELDVLNAMISCPDMAMVASIVGFSESEVYRIRLRLYRRFVKEFLPDSHELKENESE